MRLAVPLLLLVASALQFQMNPQTLLFNDNYGRTRFFHGVNAVVKVPPYLPITDHWDAQMSLSVEDIANLTSWGFNFVRLGVMWQATETSFGEYNYTYLEEVNDLITTLGEAGLYTLVDAHQDVFARVLCGEGAPDFFAQDLDHTCDYNPTSRYWEETGYCTPIAHYNWTYEDGLPTIPDCLKNVFAVYYNTPEAASAFERLYYNESGIQDHFIAHWEAVAKTLGPNPYVIGYDLLNEPLPANVWKDPLLNIPGIFDRLGLQPMYQNLNAAIRQYSDDKIIMFEPVEADLYNGTAFHSGFNETPGGVEYNNRQVLNDHTYCCQMYWWVCPTGEPGLQWAEQCYAFHESRIGTRKQDAETLGLGLILTEFGACSDSIECVTELTSVTEVCDNNLVSWAYWAYKGFQDYTTSGGGAIEGFYDAEGNLQPNKLKALSRTYIYAFQGTPLSHFFNSTTGVYTATFNLDPTITMPTELYYNSELYYPNSFDLSFSPNTPGVQSAQVTQLAPNYLAIEFPQVHVGTTVTLTFAPMQPAIA